MSTDERIVVIDDDPTMRAALREALAGTGYRVDLFADGEAAAAHLKGPGADLVISDVRMPGCGGLELLKQFGDIPFILISGFATVPEAVAAMKIGAYDFMVKPFSYRELMALVKGALVRRRTEEPVDDGDGGFVTQHPRMLALLDFARQVAKSHASILIHGESGTGKELLARYIHRHSRRTDGPFVAVNCAALPEGLLESELFGHEKGAFTGATASKPGKFELADAGTLLLDEISEMPLPLQAKLLRVLQEREVDRVGGKKPLRIDIRVVATTNRDLREMTRSGAFREDLFYRLNVVPVRLFPLRERLDDIAPLARCFFAKHGYPDASLAAATVEQLQNCSWRGNVRELFNVLERAAIVAQGGVITAEHLLRADRMGEWADTQPAAPSRPDAEAATDVFAQVPPCGKEPRPSDLSVRAMEEQLILRTLAQVRDNRTRAASLLGISVRTLRNKLKQYRERDSHGELQDGRTETV